ncbi:MAG: hypothetical protein JXR70_12620 [Spirochaetales bacterium]|nr:hypothetical protein [Spirochaetales bacterium]
MAIKQAEKFIKDIVKDNGIRKSLYQHGSSANIMAAIEEMGYLFTLYEFEESINHLKSESPDEEQSIMLDELLLWWNMLMSDGTINESEAPHCSPKKCFTCGSSSCDL